MNYFLIDGYNFLFRLKQAKGASLESQRETLIDLLNDLLAQVKGKCNLIFDSAEQIRDFPECKKLAHLDVCYTPKGLTADHYIIELAEQAKNPKILTVVTSDSGLALQCSHIGTKTLTIEAFISFLLKKNTSTQPEKPSYQETDRELQRLRKIFEERLGD